MKTKKGKCLLSALLVFTALVWLFPEKPSIVHADGNATPTVISSVLSTSPTGFTDSFPSGDIALTAGTTRAIYANGVVEDTDGQNDITSVSAVFYRSSVAGGSACSADIENCYIVSQCTLVNDVQNSNRKTFSCPMNISNIANATDGTSQWSADNWVVRVRVEDTLGASGVDSSVNKEVLSLISLTIASSLNFGTFSNAQATTAGTNSEMTFTQRGNTASDIEVSYDAAGMVCTVGVIPTQNIRWSLTDVGFSDPSTTAVTSTIVGIPLNVVRPTTANQQPEKLLYWNIKIPDSGASGSCSGTMTINAILH